jgi:uncharacterized protein (DUF2237 family)
MPKEGNDQSGARNVLGGRLQTCSESPRTGFYRDGCCHTGPNDQGRHLACVVLTDEFLNFSKEKGNDLSTPMPQYQFPGLNDGDQWCLCALRWVEAYRAGKAPKLKLEATHEMMLQLVPLDLLKQYSV